MSLTKDPIQRFVNEIPEYEFPRIRKLLLDEDFIDPEQDLIMTFKIHDDYLKEQNITYDQIAEIMVCLVKKSVEVAKDDSPVLGIANFGFERISTLDPYPCPFRKEEELDSEGNLVKEHDCGLTFVPEYDLKLHTTFLSIEDNKNDSIESYHVTTTLIHFIRDHHFFPKRKGKVLGPEFWTRVFELKPNVKFSLVEKPTDETFVIASMANQIHVLPFLEGIHYRTIQDSAKLFKMGKNEWTEYYEKLSAHQESKTLLGEALLTQIEKILKERDFEKAHDMILVSLLTEQKIISFDVKLPNRSESLFKCILYPGKALFLEKKVEYTTEIKREVVTETQQ